MGAEVEGAAGAGADGAGAEDAVEENAGAPNAGAERLGAESPGAAGPAAKGPAADWRGAGRRDSRGGGASVEARGATSKLPGMFPAPGPALACSARSAISCSAMYFSRSALAVFLHPKIKSVRKACFLNAFLSSASVSV